MGDLTTFNKINVKIKWMTSKDIPMLVSVCDNDLDWKRDDFKEFLKKKTNVILVATINEYAVGFVAFELNSNHVHITALVVDKSLRRRNIGTQLVQRVKFGFMKNGRESCQIVTNEKNTGLQLFLKKNQFLATRVLRYFFEDYSGYLFEYKDLDFYEEE